MPHQLEFQRLNRIDAAIEKHTDTPGVLRPTDLERYDLTRDAIDGLFEMPVAPQLEDENKSPGPASLRSLGGSLPTLDLAIAARLAIGDTPAARVLRGIFKEVGYVGVNQSSASDRRYKAEVTGSAEGQVQLFLWNRPAPFAIVPQEASQIVADFQGSVFTLAGQIAFASASDEEREQFKRYMDSSLRLGHGDNIAVDAGLFSRLVFETVADDSELDLLSPSKKARAKASDALRSAWGKPERLKGAIRNLLRWYVDVVWQRFGAPDPS